MLMIILFETEFQKVRWTSDDESRIEQKPVWRPG